MSDGTAIEWSDATWNFLVGCSKVSAGCTNCYAIRSVARMSGNPQFGKRYQGLVTVGQKPLNWTGKVAFIPEALMKPFSWKQPRRIFVNSLSDLFHPDVPDEWIDQAFGVMALTPRHTYQILTKRPERMAAYVAKGPWSASLAAAKGWPKQTVVQIRAHAVGDEDPQAYIEAGDFAARWPLPNVWLGTSVEQTLGCAWRITELQKAPAAVRFLSCEPLIGPVDLRRYLGPTCYRCAGSGIMTIVHLRTNYGRCNVCSGTGKVGLDWVITGGESGPKARPMDPQWARDIRDQCLSAGVAYFHKQNGGRTAKANGRLLDGVEWSQFPTVAVAGAAV